MADTNQQDRPVGEVNLTQVGQLFTEWYRQAREPSNEASVSLESLDTLQQGLFRHLDALSRQGLPLSRVRAQDIAQADDRGDLDHPAIQSRIVQLVEAIHQDNPDDTHPLLFSYDAESRSILRNGATEGATEDPPSEAGQTTPEAAQPPSEAVPEAVHEAAPEAVPETAPEVAQPTPLTFDGLRDFMQTLGDQPDVTPETAMLLRRSLMHTLGRAQTQGVEVSNLNAGQVLLAYQGLYDQQMSQGSGSRAVPPESSRLIPLMNQMVQILQRDNPEPGRTVCLPVSRESTPQGVLEGAGEDPSVVMKEIPGMEGEKEIPGMEGDAASMRAHERILAEAREQEAAALGLVTESMSLGTSLRSVGLRMARPVEASQEANQPKLTRPITFAQVARHKRADRLMLSSMDFDRIDRMLGGRPLSALDPSQQEAVEKVADRAFRRLRKGLDAKGIEFAHQGGVGQNELLLTLEKARKFSEQFQERGVFKNLVASLSSFGSALKSVFSRLVSGSTASTTSPSGGAPS